MHTIFYPQLYHKKIRFHQYCNFIEQYIENSHGNIRSVCRRESTRFSFIRRIILILYTFDIRAKVIIPSENRWYQIIGYRRYKHSRTEVRITWSR